MEGDRESVRAALRQYLTIDRLFGVRAVPIHPPGPSPGPVPAGAAVRQPVPANRRSQAQTPRPAAPSPYSAPPTPDDLAGAPPARTRPAAPAVTSPPSAPPRPAPQADPEKVRRLRLLDEQHVKGCTQCGLSRTRTQTVFGQGHAGARLVFVGEAPGFEEDRQGLAFVGRAGQLLTRMITAMNLTRDEVFICNVLKCRPPNNREPATDEIAACSPYLLEQLTTIDPEVIVALGAPAARTLLNTKESIGRLRGRFHDFFPGGPLGGKVIPLMPTYHPAYLLRSPDDKGKAWDDLQKVMAKLGLTRGS